MGGAEFKARCPTDIVLLRLITFALSCILYTIVLLYINGIPASLPDSPNRQFSINNATTPIGYIYMDHQLTIYKQSPELWSINVMCHVIYSPSYAVTRASIESLTKMRSTLRLSVYGSLWAIHI